MSRKSMTIVFAAANLTVSAVAVMLLVRLPHRLTPDIPIAEFADRWHSPGLFGVLMALLLGAAVAALQSYVIDARQPSSMRVLQGAIPPALILVAAVSRFLHVTPAAVADEGLVAYFGAYGQFVFSIVFGISSCLGFLVAIAWRSRRVGSRQRR
ncbi:MAG: hypothetical protein U1E29_06805 [Coriobacteriia bacterium]|nr:hypothetical protein [Coriobacteriia bacterium]